MQDVFSDAFTTVVNAGANVIKAKADAEARKNNAPVIPSNSGTGGLPPWALWGGLGLVGLILVVFMVKR